MVLKQVWPVSVYECTECKTIFKTAEDSIAHNMQEGKQNNTTMRDYREKPKRRKHSIAKHVICKNKYCKILSYAHMQPSM